MKKIGLLKSMRLCREYQKLDIVARNTVRKQRLDDLIAFARERSP